jgi:hypothetical protein
MDVLGDPDRIIGEARRLNDSEESNVRLKEVLEALREVESKQRRLVRLFTDGDLPESLLNSERTELSKKRAALEDERRRLEVEGRPSIDLDSIQQYLAKVMERIRRWVSDAEGEDLSLMLRALKVQMAQLRYRCESRAPCLPMQVPSRAI